MNLSGVYVSDPFSPNNQASVRCLLYCQQVSRQVAYGAHLRKNSQNFRWRYQTVREISRTLLCDPMKTWYEVRLTVVICYTERIQSRLAKAKLAGSKTERNQSTGFQVSAPVSLNALKFSSNGWITTIEREAPSGSHWGPVMGDLTERIK